VPDIPDRWFVGYDRGSVEQFAVYHDILDTQGPLRGADVVVVGNSRTQAALDHRVVVPFFEGRGQRYYNLSFGNGERAELPLAIFERLDLRPDVVLINIDGFFSPDPQGLARETFAMTRFDAAKEVIEKNAGFALRRRLHRLYPYVARASGSDWIVYRSIEHGSWDLHFVDPHPVPLGRLQYELPDTPGMRNAIRGLAHHARPVVEAFQARGCDVVLLEVPAQRRNLGAVAALAATLDVPYLDVRVDGLDIADQSHLTPESARRYAEAAVAAFAARFPASRPEGRER
jgi:hypothetical protein